MRGLAVLAVQIIAKFKVLTNFQKKFNELFLRIKYSDLEPNALKKLTLLLTPSYVPVHLLERIGNTADGGYVVFSRIEKKTKLISLGVGQDISFEKELENRVSETLFFDHSVLGLPVDVRNSKFNKLMISETQELNSVSLNDVLLQSKSDFLLLKIDIEGQEWDSFNNVSESQLLKCSQVVGEFHNLHDISEKDFYKKVKLCLEKILNTHVLINVHANNWGSYIIVHGTPLPDVLELTFLRKDLFEKIDFKSVNFEINSLSNSNLNKANNPFQPEIKLTFFSQ